MAYTDQQLGLAALVRAALLPSLGDPRPPGWDTLAATGFLGCLVSPVSGGLGLRFADTVPAFAETGRAALPGPLVETCVLGALLLPERFLGPLARGELRVSARIGDTVYAPDADAAGLLIVERPGGVLEAHPPSSVRLTPRPGLDPARRLFSVSTERPGIPLGTRVAALPALRIATVAVAAQLVGLARHLCAVADLPSGAAECAGSLVDEAAVVAGDHSLPEGEIVRAVSAAKAAAGEAAAEAAHTILRHGPRGHDLWVARVWSLGSAYGDTGLHRARLRAARLGNPELYRR
ncbi:hypothetical protein [Herbidospora sp. NBRC 101105]|uniref:hypothetical protein n=1 Tax=Herbidospora sp. NBRC 101105 TaxID=3032195 RepID=UPI0024A00C0B|nr:hypothetical protein [Herbidospora sp. NBRC 101105]GLX92083.1 hypothetical protein Hesp01_00330 [Herbidospora sp. NBRC 101105]